MDSDDEDSLCDECAALPIADIFERGTFVHFDLFEVFYPQTCKFCRFCYHALLPQDAVLPMNSPLETPLNLSISVEKFMSYSNYKSTHTAYWMNLQPCAESQTGATKTYPDDDRSLVRVQLLKASNVDASDEGCYLYGRRVLDQVDMRLVRYWLDTCHEEHTACPSTQTEYGVPGYLIDTCTRRLLPNPGFSQYAALSYVWGNENIPQLRLRELMEDEPEAETWDLGRRWAEVPQTIKDAILLCEVLSIPYLWVDALCIVLDRPSHLASCDMDIGEQMVNIYSGAFLTIVAAAGNDSWAGLPGLRNNTRKPAQDPIHIDGVTIGKVLGSPKDVMASSAWSKRAWTFQESILSNRLLIFTEAQCFWSCNYHTQCEDFHGEAQPLNSDWETTNAEYFSIPGRATKQELLQTSDLNRFNKYEMYSTILRDYTGRSITYRQDALPAFAGISTYLDRSMATSSTQGIPLQFFEQALLFQSSDGHEMLRNPHYPSWTWLGWYLAPADGRGFALDSWVGTRRLEYHLDDFESTVAWYTFHHVQQDGSAVFRVLHGIENDRSSELRSPERTVQLPASVNLSFILLFDSEVVRDLSCLATARDKAKLSAAISRRSPQTKDTKSTDHSPSSTGPEGPGLSFELVAIGKEVRVVEDLRWNDPRPDELKTVIHTLLLATDSDGISVRLDQFMIDEAVWESFGPQNRTIVLS
ncbi:hypothetical protein ACN47E_007972 [Coniothyrium glycines]